MSVKHFTLKRKRNPKPKEADRQRVPCTNLSEAIQHNCLTFPRALNSQKSKVKEVLAILIPL